MKTRPAGIGNVNADWMGSLPPKLSAMPLKHLAVPGEPLVRKDVSPLLLCPSHLHGYHNNKAIV